MNKDFLRGFGSILELSPRNAQDDELFPDFIKDDTEALKNDWETVGLDILKAADSITHYGKKN